MKDVITMKKVVGVHFFVASKLFEELMKRNKFSALSKE